jgi:hypothetical protein
MFCWYQSRKHRNMVLINGTQDYTVYVSILQSQSSQEKIEILCTSSNIVISRCASRAVMFRIGSFRGLSVANLARDGKCQIVMLNF